VSDSEEEYEEEEEEEADPNKGQRKPRGTLEMQGVRDRVAAGGSMKVEDVLSLSPVRLIGFVISYCFST